MRVLLDECLPRKLRHSFPDHQCETVPNAGLAGKKNGTLLSLAEDQGFQVLLTMDKGLQYQQNLMGRRISVLIVHAKSNRLADLLPHVEGCQLALSSMSPGQIVRVGR